MSNVQLVTIEELIEAAGLAENDYSRELLRQYIEDFEITKDNVNTLNIKLLLENYSGDDELDVSEIFSEDMPQRNSNFTKNAVAIAFLENRNTDIMCAYYDFERGLCYKAKQMYLFDDLSQVDSEKITDADGILSKMDKLNVFSWMDVDGSDGIDDSQTMIFIVKYSDGSAFKVEANGILSQSLPASYEELKELLMG